MTAAIPPYDPATGVRIEFRRGSLKALLIGLPLTGFLATVSIMGAIWPKEYLTNGADNTAGAWMAGGCGCMFGGLFLMALVSIPSMLRKRGLDLDKHGITLWEAETRMLFPWQELAAVGVGYKISPAPGQMVRPKQGQALEIYSSGYAFEQRFPKAADLVVTETPPHSGLPGHRYRIMLPPFDGAAGQAEHGVRSFAPHLWLGHYQREWHRIPGK